MVDYDGVSRQILVKILFSSLDVPLPPDFKEILLS